MKSSLPSTAHRWVVSFDQVGMKLVDFLLLQHPEQSASFWRKQIDFQSVWVNVAPARLASRKLEAFDVVLYNPPRSPDWKILSSEDDFWVLDKPWGQNYEAGRDFLSQQHHQPFPVHRLDQMTTGLLLMARHKEAQEELTALFKNRKMQKKYLAFVWGVPKSKNGEINLRLEERASKHGGVKVQVSQSSRAEEAITAWSCLSSHEGISLLLCEPKTGRTHQIRAHLSHVGMPIIGDRDYLPEKTPRGWRGNIFANQHLLHAYELSFYWKGQPRLWRSGLKGDMKRMAELLNIKAVECEE